MPTITNMYKSDLTCRLSKPEINHAELNYCILFNLSYMKKRGLTCTWSGCITPPVGYKTNSINIMEDERNRVQGNRVISVWTVRTRTRMPHETYNIPMGC